MEIKNLCKTFGDKSVFDNLSLSIPEGKITFIMGESGCGKTTLLRLIASLDTDYRGEISKKSDFISIVFQEPRLFPAISVKQNLEIIKKGTYLSLDDILKAVELHGEESSLPENLSGGMKMRLSLARALYYNGDVFLMDEPFSALDENMKNRIIPRVFELLKGKTVIIISHDITEAEKYADNIINLKSKIASAE